MLQFPPRTSTSDRMTERTLQPFVPMSVDANL